MSERAKPPSAGRMVPASAGEAPPRPSTRGSSTKSSITNNGNNPNRKNRRSLYLPASAADGGGAPEVYWSDGAAVQTQTFLREPTPEPDDQGREKRAGGGGYYDDDGEVRHSKDRRICGARPVVFWGIVAVGLMVLVGIAIGVGVGVGLKKPTPTLSQDGGSSSRSGDAVSSAIPSGTSAPEPSESSIFRGTSDSSSMAKDTPSTTRDAAYPTQTSSGSLTCPQSNYTLYAVPGSPVRFLRHCDVDMTGVQATDLKTVRTESMAECMRNCAGTAGCQGSGWGTVRSDTGTEYWCWLKGGLGTEFTALAGWEFAVMQ